MRLVAGLGGHLADGVDKVDARHPLVIGQLDLTGEVVQMTKEAGEDLAVPGRNLVTHGVDDMLGEGGVEAAGGWDGAVEVRVAIDAVGTVCSVGRHCAVCVEEVVEERVAYKWMMVEPRCERIDEQS